MRSYYLTPRLTERVPAWSQLRVVVADTLPGTPSRSRAPQLRADRPPVSIAGASAKAVRFGLRSGSLKARSCQSVEPPPPRCLRFARIPPIANAWSRMERSNIASRMAAGASWMVLFKLLDRGMGLVSVVILARLLVPADFGLIAVAMSLIALLEVLGAFGLETALIQRTDARREHYDTVWT